MQAPHPTRRELSQRIQLLARPFLSAWPHVLAAYDVKSREGGRRFVSSKRNRPSCRHKLVSTFYPYFGRWVQNCQIKKLRSQEQLLQFSLIFKLKIRQMPCAAIISLYALKCKFCKYASKVRKGAQVTGCTAVSVPYTRHRLLRRKLRMPSAAL